jgi:hypothetical protein
MLQLETFFNTINIFLKEREFFVFSIFFRIFFIFSNEKSFFYDMKKGGIFYLKVMEVGAGT